MKLDNSATPEKLVDDPALTDYDFWRGLKNLENELFRLTVDHQPIPIELLRWRRMLGEARATRYGR